MKTILLCKNCSANVDIHAQGYCHPCYKKHLRNELITKLYSQPKIITSAQHNVIIGSMLGDGSIKRGGKTKRANAQFTIVRAAIDVDYLLWEFNILKSLSHSKDIKYRDVFDKRTDKTYHSINFQTMRCELLNSYYDEWYPNGKKVVPHNLELNGRIMAVWFCDDASIYYDNNPYILNICWATNGFSKDEVYFLRDLLVNRYNEVFFVSEQKNNNNNQYLIGAANDATRTVLSDIDPYIMGFMDRKSNIWRRDEARFYNNQPRRCMVEKILIDFIHKKKSFTSYDVAEYLGVLRNNIPMAEVYIKYINKYINNGFLDKTISLARTRQHNFSLTKKGEKELRFDPYFYIKGHKDYK
jgi:hypothetical protein